jgi:hypothetical protein
MMASWRTKAGRLLLDLGPISEEDGELVGDLLAALGRARHGDATAALVAIARERKERGLRGGSAILRINEGSGPDPRPIDWSTSTEFAERRRTG